MTARTSIAPALEAMADEALATSRPVSRIVDGAELLAVPDLLALEAAANGLRVPRGYVLQRADGRSVSIGRVVRAGDRR